jgi:SAM-dependent methyltransferase
MRWLCPNCHSLIDPDSLTCAAGHQFTVEDGALVLLADDFGRDLHAFLASFQSLRAVGDKRLLDLTVYEHLPAVRSDLGDAQFQLEWRLRRYDLAIVLERLRDRVRQSILDIGAWNGWLSHQLAKRDHAVTAIDYFVDKYDGLGARQFYNTHWQAIQMDLVDLSVLDGCFDVIIVNRCLQFFTEPIAYVAGLQQKLSAGGMLIITGLQFFDDSSRKAREVAEMLSWHRRRYGFNLFLRPSKGYLDAHDRRDLQALGVGLHGYPQLWRANLKAMIKRTRPHHAYGVYRAEPRA